MPWLPRCSGDVPVGREAGWGEVEPTALHHQGPFPDLEWIAAMYSPRMPKKNSCTPEKKNSAVISVGMPAGASRA